MIDMPPELPEDWLTVDLRCGGYFCAIDSRAIIEAIVCLPPPLKSDSVVSYSLKSLPVDFWELCLVCLLCCDDERDSFAIIEASVCLPLVMLGVLGFVDDDADDRVVSYSLYSLVFEFLCIIVLRWGCDGDESDSFAIIEASVCLG